MAVLYFLNGLGPYKSVAERVENNVEFWFSLPCFDSVRSWLTPCCDLSTFYIIRNTPKIPTRGDVALLSRSVSTSTPDRICMACIWYVILPHGNAFDLNIVGTERVNTSDDGRLVNTDPLTKSLTVWLSFQWSSFVKCFVYNKFRVKFRRCSNDTENTSFVITRIKREALHLIVFLTGIHRLLITSKGGRFFPQRTPLPRSNPDSIVAICT